VCRLHGGAAPQVKRRAAVRAELSAWRLGEATVDPGETLLRLVSQSARRSALYSDLLERAYAGDPGFPAAFAGAGVAALIGHRLVHAGDGQTVAVAEDIRGLVRLESEERDRCARLCKLAIDAGIAERQVRMAEREGATLAAVIRRVLDGLGLSAEQQVLAPVLVAREARAVGGVPVFDVAEAGS
jgi:hypothetical protein